MFYECTESSNGLKLTMQNSQAAHSFQSAVSLKYCI